MREGPCLQPQALCCTRHACLHTRSRRTQPPACARFSSTVRTVSGLVVVGTKSQHRTAAQCLHIRCSSRGSIQERCDSMPRHRRTLTAHRQAVL